MRLLLCGNTGRGAGLRSGGSVSHEGPAVLTAAPRLPGLVSLCAGNTQQVKSAAHDGASVLLRQQLRKRQELSGHEISVWTGIYPQRVGRTVDPLNTEGARLPDALILPSFPLRKSMFYVNN